MLRQVDHQEERAVDGVAFHDESEGGADGQHGHHQEDDQGHQRVRSAGMGTGERGRPSASAGSRASKSSFV